MSKQGKVERSDDELDRIRREALEFAGIGLYKFKFDGTVLFMDRGALRIFELEDGFPDPGAIAGKDLADLVVYTGPKGLMRKEIRKRKRIRGREWSFRTLKGNEKRVLEDSYLSRDLQTGEEAVQVVVRDVTEHKRAEDALRESETRLRALSEGIDDALFVHDEEGRILDCNAAACRRLGFTREELLAMRTSDIDSPDFSEGFGQRLERQLAGGRYSCEGVHVAKDGRRIPVDINTSVIDYAGRKAVLAVMRDITERKRAVKALRESEERFRQVTENAKEWIWQVDADGLYTYASPVVETILGYKPKELVGKKHFYYFFRPEERERLKRAAFAVFARRDPFSDFVNRNVAKDGHVVWLSTSGTPVFDGHGELVGYRGADTDITERRRSEEALRASERRFRETLENAQLVAVQADTEGRTTFCNDFLLELTGWQREEVLGKNWFELLIPEELREEIRRVFTNSPEDIPGHYENPILTRTGERRLISWSNTILRDEANTPVGITCIGEDITYRKQAEEALAWSAHVSDRLRGLVLTLNSCTTLDEMLAPLLDTAIDVSRMDGGGICLIEGAETVLRHHQGLPEAFVREVARKPLSRSVMEAVLTSDGPLDLTDLPPDGQAAHKAHGLRHVYSVALRAGGEAFGFLNLASFRDIGPTPADLQTLGVVALEAQSLFNRLRVESALRESEEKYREILEEIQEGYYEVDLAGNFTFFNDALCRTLGYAKEKMLGLNYRDYHAGEGATTDVYRTYSQVYRTGVPIQVFDWQVVRKDGSKVTVEVSISLMRDTADQPIGFRGIVRDVTERQQAEQARREAEERYRELFENANDIAYTHDLDGRLTSWNTAGERVTGFSKKEAYALTSVLEIVAPEHRATARKMIEKKIAGEEPTRYELEIVAKDGHRVPVEVSTRLVYRDGVPVGVQGIARDMTERIRAEEERQRLEAQIGHSQKLEGLGVLAGGIAHDFNNLLVGVLGYAGLALTKLDAEAPARAYVENIEASAQRAAELTSQMLAYSGKATFAVQPLDLSKLAQEMGNLLGAAVSKKAVLKYHCDPRLPLIHGDASQLHQVIMNLIINASEAIGDEQGVITLSTNILEADRDYLTTTFLDDELSAGRYVCLSVSDTGCGMDEETQSRVFDPFFSTKFTGRGLGLASVLGIVRGHKGAIKVYSEVGRGTTVRVLFPAIKSDVPQERLRTLAEGAEDLVHWIGSGTILVADDEEAPRAVAKATLEEHGFQVLMASDGREAIEVFREHADEISGVLLDLTMPVVGGDEAFEEIQRIRPDVPIILSSGYTEQDVSGRFAEKCPAAFLQKPYLVPALVRKFHDVLES